MLVCVHACACACVHVNARVQVCWPITCFVTSYFWHALTVPRSAPLCKNQWVLLQSTSLLSICHKAVEQTSTWSIPCWRLYSLQNHCATLSTPSTRQLSPDFTGTASKFNSVQPTCVQSVVDLFAKMGLHTNMKQQNTNYAHPSIYPPTD